jgi:hypothetical protein
MTSIDRNGIISSAFSSSKMHNLDPSKLFIKQSLQDVQ